MFETVIGLEVHIELLTKSKLFCACSAAFGAAPNENVCPACLGLRDIPPRLNKRAVELAIAAGLLTNSKIASVSSFERKHYFYPDLPTGFQRTQYFEPICTDGHVDIYVGTKKTEITLKQIHIEEDAGKLVHEKGRTLVDYNRAGVPLIEIVSNPDFRDASECIAYIDKLRELFTFANISDCKMQEGSMRADVNISVRPMGETALGVRTEIKNMNSRKSINAAIEYEVSRHIDALNTGARLIQETRGWDENRQATYSMREKEEAEDYRYMPDPYGIRFKVSDAWIEQVRNALPDSAESNYLRLTENGLTEYAAQIITSNKNLFDIFDKTNKCLDNPTEIANWIITELLAAFKTENKGADDICVDHRKFAEIIGLVNSKKINRASGKELLAKLLNDDIEPLEYIKTHDLGIVSDIDSVTAVVSEVLDKHPEAVAEYKSGTAKVKGYLIGQIMRELKGKGDPALVNKLLDEIIG